MNKITFESIYNRVQSSSLNIMDDTEKEELIDRILENDIDYTNQSKDQIQLLEEHQAKMYEKKYGNISYGTYMYQYQIINDIVVDENYNLIPMPITYKYLASMVVVKEDKTGRYTLDHIMALSDDEEKKVQEHYDYLVHILETCTEEQLLKLIDSKIDNYV